MTLIPEHRSKTYCHTITTIVGILTLLNRGMVLDTLPVCEELVEKLEATVNQVPMAPAAPATAPVAPGAVDI
jgi:hypothetical protein